MRFYSLAALAACGAVTLLSRPALSQEAGSALSQETGEVLVARLIRTLGADSYTERQAADEALGKLGSQSRAQVEAAAQSTDPEIRLRAGGILRRIKTDELWMPSVVNYSSHGDNVTKALAAIGQRSGNHLLIGARYGQLQDGPLEVDYAGTSFWEAIDNICQRSGNHVQPSYDSRDPGFTISSGSPGKFPTTYAGPLRAQLTGAVRNFNEKYDYEDLHSRCTQTFEFDVQLVWEERFGMIAYRNNPELISAVAGGQPLPASTTPVTNNGWNMTGDGLRQTTAKISLPPPSTGAKQLDQMTLKWSLIAVGDMVTLDCDNPAAGRTAHQDDVDLRIETFEPQRDGRYEMTLSINREMTLPEPPDLVFQEYHIEMFDAKGQAFSPQQRSNLLTEGGVRCQITFSGPSLDSAPKVLRLTYPRLRSQRDVKFTFHDVPLPTGRPE